MKITLEDILKQQESSQKKISLHEELLSSLEKVLSDGVEKAIAEFRTEAEKEKEILSAELKTKTQQAMEYVNSLKPIKSVDGKTPTNDELNKLIIPLIPKIKDGKTPIKGIDYFDGTTPIKGKDYNDGKDGSPDTGKQIISKINDLPIQSELQIDYLHIKNIPKETPLFSKGHLGRGTGSPVFEYEFSLDGSTKIFTVPNSNRIVSISSTSAPFRFSLTTDYTVAQSGTSSVITFGSNITASSDLATGQTLFVQYIQQT